MADPAYLRQDDPRLNEAEAWPRSAFPEAEYTYFRECGCLVCALAALLQRHGYEDGAAFDPWVLNQRLAACGAFTPSADLELEEIRRLYPLAYTGQTPYSREALTQLAESGALCLITVPGTRAERHFTALLRLTPDDAVVFDPLCGERILSGYERICEIRALRRVDQKSL